MQRKWTRFQDTFEYNLDKVLDAMLQSTAKPTVQIVNCHIIPNTCILLSIVIFVVKVYEACKYGKIEVIQTLMKSSESKGIKSKVHIVKNVFS